MWRDMNHAYVSRLSTGWGVRRGLGSCPCPLPQGHPVHPDSRADFMSFGFPGGEFVYDEHRPSLASEVFVMVVDLEAIFPALSC